jgi:glutamate formiminotransferase / formiminotetrahydrofolate cyclodeaminase
VECIPNFSEGRNAAVVNEIAAAIARGPGLAVLGNTMDADHNRSVITFAGSPDAVAEAAVRAVGKAAELIDLRSHSGVHPRIGAADVLPFVPVEGVTMEDCVELSIAVGEEIWRRFGIPVYLYEESARIPERRRLENIRRGQFEELREAATTQPSWRPDIGGPALHASAGAVVTGARQFLIAYNINLDSEDVSIAKRIAQKIRASSGGFPNVKALGLALPSRQQTQVSMNLTDFRRTPMHIVYEAVREQAEALGVAVAGSELIGLIPRAALEMAVDHYFRFENFTPDAVLENRLEALLPYSLDDVLDDMSDPKRAVGGGSAAALAGAMAASLGVLTARLMKGEPAPFVEHRVAFRLAADRDAQAFAALMRTSDPAQEAVVEATDAPLEIAERAAALHADLVGLAAECPNRFVSDITTGVGLAMAAKNGAVATVELNLPRIADTALRENMAARLQTVKLE